GQGPPLVLLHGLGGRAGNWTSWLPVLTKTHKVYAIDLLGFGDSDKPRDADYSMALQASLLRQFFDSQQLDRADLIGYSMGGWISLKFASQSPERLNRLVLIASPGMIFQPRWDRRILKAGSTDALQEMIRVEGGSPPPVFILRDVVRV